MSRPPLILASASPRRQTLLRAGDIDFMLRVSEINEAEFASGEPRAVAMKTAVAKAEKVKNHLPADTSPQTLILAADTIVVFQQEIFGKPSDRDVARAMLERLSGQRHTVITGMALQRTSGEMLVDTAVAHVTFNYLTPELIEEYVASGEADDKAGAYGIQGFGAHLVASVEGDLTSVIGLPLSLLIDLYRCLTGLELFERKSPRSIACVAFPDLAKLPPACLLGIPN